jgi:hypothetical protein
VHAWHCVQLYWTAQRSKEGCPSQHTCTLHLPCRAAHPHLILGFPDAVPEPCMPTHFACRDRDRLYERAEKVGSTLVRLGDQLKEAIEGVNASTGECVWWWWWWGEAGKTVCDCAYISMGWVLAIWIVAAQAVLPGLHYGPLPEQDA